MNTLSLNLGEHNRHNQEEGLERGLLLAAGQESTVDNCQSKVFSSKEAKVSLRKYTHVYIFLHRKLIIICRGESIPECIQFEVITTYSIGKMPGILLA